jgi:hypothetical protein
MGHPVKWPRRSRRLMTADGLPARRHPESLERELPEGDEEWLGGLCGALWPDDEYAEILEEFRNGGGAPP